MKQPHRNVEILVMGKKHDRRIETECKDAGQHFYSHTEDKFQADLDSRAYSLK